MREQRCLWCGAEFARSEGPGRPRLYCRRSHRQRHHEARSLGARIGLGADDVLVSRRKFEELRDRLYLLEAALEDAALDLAEGGDLWPTFGHVRDAAAAVVELPLEPKAVGS